MNKDRVHFFASLTVSVGGIVLLGYIFIRYLFLAFLPFIIAWGAAFLIRPLAHRISTSLGIPTKAGRVILTVLIVAIGLTLFAVLAVYTVRWCIDFFSSLSENEGFYEVLSKIMNPIGGLFGDREGGKELELKISESIKEMLSSLLSSLGGLITSFAAAVPGVLIFLLVSVSSAVYFSLDLEGVNAFCLSVLPKRVGEALIKFKERFTVAIIKYIRAYITIMLITFVILTVGFLILKVKGFLVLAFLISLLDALPLLGVGTVLVPWSVFSLISGKIYLGVGLVLLFIVNELVRQFAEPKILGRHLGIHPILSLMLLYLGYYFFGIFGLILIPILSVVINILTNKDSATKVGKRSVGE